MKTSDTVTDLAIALANAQGEMRNPPRDKMNPHFKSKYADLATTIDSARPTLAKHGLSMLQTVASDPANSIVYVTTRIMHKTGQWIEDTLTVQARDPSPQAMGSAITYGKRYSWGGFTGQAPDEDDDGNDATGKSNAQQKPPQRSQAISQQRPAANKTVPIEQMLTKEELAQTYNGSDQHKRFLLSVMKQIKPDIALEHVRIVADAMATNKIPLARARVFTDSCLKDFAKAEAEAGH